MQRAREALARHLDVAVDEVTVTGAEARTWSDSSMGCGQPGSMAATVITEGFAVSATAGGRPYAVHVSGENVVVCGPATLTRRDRSPAVRAEGIDVLMERAREDLAQRLKVEPAAIRLDGVRGQQWPDSGLGCPQPGETIEPGPVEGLVIALRYRGRLYLYHTDRHTLRPCPAIEAE
ncbi:MAG TPA: hypothetical protein PKN91_05770 [Steroidobacteraceae bacterium]|nr:hypothetical protein [Steroidobacteraceae bacterium]